jgi:transcriptional regulator with XRE-family HTH domain
MDIKEVIGNNIKRHRIDKNLSQEQLANDSEIDRTYLQSIEKGKRNVSINVLIRLSSALNVQLIKLLEESIT